MKVPKVRVALLFPGRECLTRRPLCRRSSTSRSRSICRGCAGSTGPSARSCTGRTCLTKTTARATKTSISTGPRARSGARWTTGTRPEWAARRKKPRSSPLALRPASVVRRRAYLTPLGPTERWTRHARFLSGSLTHSYDTAFSLALASTIISHTLDGFRAPG